MVGQQPQQVNGHPHCCRSTFAEASEWRQAQPAANGRPQMTLQQHHSGAEKPSTFAGNYAGLQQQELTGSAALQNTAASRTQGMQVHSCTLYVCRNVSWAALYKLGFSFY